MALDSNLGNSHGNQRAKHTHTHTAGTKYTSSLPPSCYIESEPHSPHMYYSRLSGQRREKAWIEEKEAQHRSACLILIGGRERDGRGTAARHGSLGCQEMAIYRRHSMAVCATISTLQGSYLSAEGRFFSPSKCVQHEHVEESIKDWSTWVTFLISSSQGDDTEINVGRRTKFTGHTAAKNVALWQRTDHLITVARLQFPHLVKCWGKTLNVSSYVRYLAERRP